MVPVSGVPERSGARAVERAISVLDCFSTASARLSLAELAVRANLPASTTYRIAQALVRGGLLERGGRDGYQVGPGMVALARPVLSRMRIDAAAPHLYQLAERIRLPVSLGVAGDSDLITLICARPTVRAWDDQLSSGREPLHASAMGKTVLAFGQQGPRTRSDANVLVRFTSRTITSATELSEDLARTRQRGFALSDEEQNEGVRALAVPVFTAERGPAIGAIGVHAPSERLTDQLVRELVPALQYFSRLVGRELDAPAREAGSPLTMRERACSEDDLP
ncbi:MAG: IclR family transcriptional regulator [Acidimicrobiaceae bacterium]|nr:IclR family transcriptional regulator [Acidimicrobiaceae bacterium]